MKKAHEYLLLKKNNDGLIYDRLVFEKSKEARKQFQKMIHYWNVEQNLYFMVTTGKDGP